MPRFQAATLEAAGSRIFAGAGVPEHEAQIVARSLVQSNLLGHDSHGVIRIQQYVNNVRSGLTRADAVIRTVQEAPAMAVLDGGWGFGQVVARHAAELAIAKARQHTVGVVTAYHCNHVGRLGEYVEIAAQAGMLALATVNNHGQGRLLAPFGAKAGRLSPNPIAFGAPRPGDVPFIMDLTPSVVPEGKVRVKRNRGEPLPPGWVQDAEGRPTTDANALYAGGSLLPLGGPVGHKGFALALMVEILSGALGGAGVSRPNPERGGNGLFYVAINPESFLPREQFLSEMQVLADHVKSSPPIDGVAEVFLPGEPEFRTRAGRLRDGIDVEPETVRQIIETGREVGVDVGEILG
jgi:hydroxycarboxylate dehydrogenase B